MSFAEWLKERRLDARLTQTELADRAGVTRTAVTKWEAGEATPKRTNIPALAMALGLSERDTYEAAGFSSVALPQIVITNEDGTIHSVGESLDDLRAPTRAEAIEIIKRQLATNEQIVRQNQQLIDMLKTLTDEPSKN